MEFAHGYINMRRIVCVYIIIYYYISYFIKMKGAGNLSIKLFNDSFVSVKFKYGQRVSLYAHVWSIVMDGVDQAVTGGRLRQ